MRFVFVHGGFHAGWCWEPTIAELQRLGHDGVAVDLPGHGARVDEESTLANRRDAIVAKLQLKPYPTPEAIAHTYEIAVKEYGAQGINPMSLWDLHWVKTLDDEGFIDGLINGMALRRNT